MSNFTMSLEVADWFYSNIMALEVYQEYQDQVADVHDLEYYDDKVYDASLRLFEMFGFNEIPDMVA